MPRAQGQTLPSNCVLLHATVETLTYMYRNMLIQIFSWDVKHVLNHYFPADLQVGMGEHDARIGLKCDMIVATGQ